MRSILLLFVIMIVTPSALIMPHLGVLVWTWMSIMNPHRLSWGFTMDLPFVMVIASVTLLSWFMSREPKLPPSRLLIWAAVAFSIQITISSLVALHPEHSWPLWDRTIKTLVLFFVAAAIINSKVRIQAMLWIIAISLGFYSANGVMAALSSGGVNVLTGPPRTMIADNNHLALSLVILLPILNYLRATTANAFVRLAVTLVILFTLAAVITSYSRGALVALVIGVFAFLRSARGRVVMIILVASLSYFAINLMPEKWQDRVNSMQSIETITEDKSFSGRMDAWYVSWRVATARPFTGGGFSSTEHPATFLRYLPESSRGWAAHSVYFQVLGDHGFIGLGLYLTMIGAGLLHLRRVRARARRHAGMEWADQLAKMLQISILSFLVGGAALSVAYFDLILLILVLAMNTDLVTARETEAEEAVFPAAGEPGRVQA